MLGPADLESGVGGPQQVIRQPPYGLLGGYA